MLFKKYAIVGAGGFAREVRASMNLSKSEFSYFVDDEYYDSIPDKTNILPLSNLIKNINKYHVLVAIGDPRIREVMVNKLPISTIFFSHISDSAIIMDDNIEIGVGTFIGAGTIVTTNCKIGNHCQLNIQTTIGHDTILGDYVTTAPSVNVSGNCIIGKAVYFGTKAVVKQQVSICEYTIIGMNAGVVKNIDKCGTYVGTPAKELIR
jgi:sugar O-acyltransferase (sialic acid O-acetyltransferase NeuD family)